MEGLYKKVIKGLYRKIPGNYSGELSQVIRMLLQTIPEMRPSCDRVLNFPFVTQKIESFGLQKESEISVLLNTIKIPKNLFQLSSKLPQP